MACRNGKVFALLWFIGKSSQPGRMIAFAKTPRKIEVQIPSLRTGPINYSSNSKVRSKGAAAAQPLAWLVGHS
jgi:hypothetical protein